MAQQPVSSEKTAAVDQLEQLMREQQSLQMRQTQQLQSIRQQIDEQERMNAQQDWQWVGSLALLLLLAVSSVWLMRQWPYWQQARLARQQQRQEEREQAATAQMLRQAQPHDEAADMGADWHGDGGEIDHSGPGALENLLRKVKLKKALKRERRKAQSKPLSDLPAGQGWLAVLDEPDSQLLADEAMREFELRRAVGLQQEPELPPASAKAAERQHAIDTESAWQAMEEILLAESPSASHVENSSSISGESVGVGATVEAGVDVSLEVQRVRRGLRARREQRKLTVLPAAEPRDEVATTQQTLHAGVQCDIPVSLPEEAMAESALEAASDDQSVAAQAVDVAADLDALVTQHHSNSHAILGAAQHTSHTSFSISSLPAHTEAETRLALGYEFQKLGQHDEAAQLYEEVLAMGSGIDQQRARQLLSALPGR
jgi:tetratricopeptide (TPR) repeat protein